MTASVRYASADAVEAAFYTAFAACKLEAMMAVWSSDQACCIHPGAQPLLGLEAIRRSWEHIMTDAQAPAIRLVPVHRMTSEDMAVHLVEEHIGAVDDPAPRAVVLATNIYRRDAGGWRLVSHQGAVLPPEQGRVLQ